MATIYEYLPDLLLRGPVVIECGAHVGVDTEKLMAAMHDIRGGGTLIAFEPDPRNYPRLLKLNAPAGVKYSAVKAAVGRKPGQAKLYLSSGRPHAGALENTASSSLKRPRKHLERWPWCKFDNYVNVAVTTLDDEIAVRKLWEIDLVWMDVQGAEADVIRGGRSAFTHTRYLYTEVYEDEMYAGQPSLSDLLNLLPGQWKVVEQWPTEVLLFHADFQIGR